MGYINKYAEWQTVSEAYFHTFKLRPQVERSFLLLPSEFHSILTKKTVAAASESNATEIMSSTVLRVTPQGIVSNSSLHSDKYYEKDTKLRNKLKIPQFFHF